MFTTEGNYIASSQVGLRQGDPLAPFFFCLATLPIEDFIVSSFPTIKCKSYMDDQSFVGPLEDLLTISPILTAKLAAIGLVRNHSKGKIYTSDGGIKYLQHRLDNNAAPQELDYTLQNLTTDGLVILGSPMGKENFVSDNAMETVTKQSKILDILPQLCVGIAYILAQSCIKVRVNFLARVTPPDIINPAILFFDNAMISMMSELMDQRNERANDINSILKECPWATKILSLPVKAGGLGLRQVQHISMAAYTSSIMTSLHKSMNQSRGNG
jgi:hypothetical protein